MSAPQEYFDIIAKQAQTIDTLQLKVSQLEASLERYINTLQEIKEKLTELVKDIQ